MNAKFIPLFAGDFLFLQTDWNAPKRRILRVDLHHLDRENWREIVPAGEDSIEDSSVVNNRLFVTYLHNVSSRILEFSLEWKLRSEIPTPEAGSGGLQGRTDQQDGILTFTSYTTPYSIYIFNAATGTKTLWYRDAVPGFDSEQFQSEQFWYSSKDGTRIPIFLVHRRGLKADGHIPTILYGYGGFNASFTPFFSPQNRLVD